MRRQDAWKVRTLDPDSAVQMDAFNEEYASACSQLGISREQMNVTVEQAARYLRISVFTLKRYLYARPPVLEKVLLVRQSDNRLIAHVVLDSAVECVVSRQLGIR